MSFQYVNTHNKAIGVVLNCNTNVQIGNGSHVFYSTCYLSKSTQEEDKERQQRVHNAIIKLLIKREQEVLLSSSCDEENDDNTFVDGLCAMLRGVNAATSKHVVSLSMGHLITMLDGSRFEYLHEFVQHGFGAMRDEWQQYHYYQDQKVQLLLPTKCIEGICRGVNQVGALIIEHSARLHV